MVMGIFVSAETDLVSIGPFYAPDVGD